MLFGQLRRDNREEVLKRRRNVRRRWRRRGAVRFQDSYHGAGCYSVQAFDERGQLLADVTIAT